MSTQPYFLKHKPTGLYFRPKGSGATNLTTKGKIYTNDYVYNRFTDPNNVWADFDSVILSKSIGNKKIVPKEFEIGRSIRNGDYPNLEIQYDWSHKGWIYISIKSHPEDWEKEYINVTIEKA